MDHQSRITCLICTQEFQDNSHLPKEFTDLSLLTCTSCYNSVFWENDIERASFISSLALFEKQTSQLNPLETLKSQSEQCPFHNKPNDYYCVLDKCTMCLDCALAGKHKGHDKKELSALKDKSKTGTQIYLLAHLVENLYTRFIKKPLDNQTEQLCKKIEECFSECIVKLAAKKQEILSKLQSNHREKLNAEAGPQMKMLVEWSQEMNKKMSKVGTEHDVGYAFDLLKENPRKIAGEFREWLKGISKQKLTLEQSSPIDDADWKKLEALSQYIDQLGLKTQPIPQPVNFNRVPEDKRVRSPVRSNPREERKETRAESPPRKSDSVKQLCDYFKISAMQSTYAEFRYAPGHELNTSANNIKTLNSWQNSGIKELRLDFPYAKISGDVNPGMRYLLNCRSLTSLFLIIDGTLLDKSNGWGLKSFFKSMSQVQNLSQFSLKIHESSPANNESKENFYSTLFGALTDLKRLEKLNLEILLFDIDDDQCSGLLRRIRENTHVKELSLSIKDGSPISNNPICSIFSICAKMKRLEKLSLRTPWCHKITQNGVQKFFEVTPGVGKLKEINFDLNGCAIVFEGINVPYGWKKTCPDSTITAKKQS